MKGISATNEQLERYASWLVCRRTLRRPRTLRELAKELNVSARTLTNWRRNPILIELVAKKRAELPPTESQEEIREVYRLKALDGDLAAAKFYTEHFMGRNPGGDHCPICEVRGRVSDLLAGLDNETLDRLENWLKGIEEGTLEIIEIPWRHGDGGIIK